MIDRSLNYGRHCVRRFLRKSVPYRVVLDMGAGGGDDLALAQELQPKAKRFGVEVHSPYAKKLSSQHIRVLPLNIEKDRLPLGNGKVDVVIMNQVSEHTKEVFWIFHEVSRVLPVGANLILRVPNMPPLHNLTLLTLLIHPAR